MRYWKFSPGRGHYYWDFCNNNSVAAIGWQRVGDLTQYRTLKELSEAFEKAGYPCCKWCTGDAQLWKFKNDVSKNDRIVAYGRGFILSVGMVISGYYVDEENPIDLEWDVWYSHRRKIKWKPNTMRDVRDDDILFGNPTEYYGTLNKQLTFYEITDEYTKKYVEKLLTNT